jgi:hypothetical protein
MAKTENKKSFDPFGSFIDWGSRKRLPMAGILAGVLTITSLVNKAVSNFIQSTPIDNTKSVPDTSGSKPAVNTSAITDLDSLYFSKIGPNVSHSAATQKAQPGSSIRSENSPTPAHNHAPAVGGLTGALGAN